ncbi:MAG: Ig-like domain-containing protein [Chitinophagales bacterium]
MIFRSCCYFILVSLLASCASQIPPSGGPKDVTPPSVVHENPENLSVNFHSKKIVLNFDEYVQLNDPSNQIFFSPALTGKVLYRLRGKSLVITLPDSMKSNTTYTVNFGSAIKDNTEGNIMLNYQYVFSTGAAIDSFRIQGKVVNALDGKSKPNLLVMLYSDLSDSAVAKKRPDYNARTDSNGNFVLNHLRGNTYHLIAIDDQNFDLMYDQPGETVAFSDTNFTVHDTLDYFKLFLFKPEAEKQSVLGTFSRQPGKAAIAFAKRTKKLKVTAMNDSLTTFVEFNSGMDTVSVWVNDVKSDSVAFKLQDQDFSDTVKVRMKVPPTKQKLASKPKFSITMASLNKIGAPIRKNDALQLIFSAPVVEVSNSRKIFLRNDSTKKESEVMPVIVRDSMTKQQRALIKFPFEEAFKYTLLIPDSTFRDIYGAWNDSTKIHVVVYDEEDLGNLNLKVSFADSASSFPFYYELQTKEGAMIARRQMKAKNTTLSFTSLPPGDYNFKLIEDRNNNFIWDSGNYWKHLQPERIFFYTGVITIRANWDVDLQMKVDKK